MTKDDRIAVEIMGLQCECVGDYWGNCKIHGTYPVNSFSTNLNACFAMEEKINEKGLAREYWSALSKIVSGDTIVIGKDAFKLIHASALQRSQAAVNMLKGMK